MQQHPAVRWIKSALHLSTVLGSPNHEIHVVGVFFYDALLRLLSLLSPPRLGLFLAIRQLFDQGGAIGCVD